MDFSKAVEGRRGITAFLAATLSVCLIIATNVGPAFAAQPAQDHDNVVSAVPSSDTPDITNGKVSAIAEVGSRIVVGGTFSGVQSAGSSTTLSRPFLFAFDSATGVVDAGFQPAVNAEVETVIPAADGNSVYVGGRFTGRLALLSLTDGAPIGGFQPPAFGGSGTFVSDLVLTGGRLYVGGAFTTVGGVAHAGLATLNPVTGAVDPFVDLQVSGHHNYDGTGAFSAVGVTKFDVTPDGSRLVAIGNFTQVSGFDRDQLVMIDLTGPQAAVNPNWNTLAFTPPCRPTSYDYWVRGVQFSPDGSYFVVVSTGGYDGGSFNACDAATRFETNSTGTDLRPTWLNATGADSLYSVAITGTAVYVGGHQRWLNNPYGQDDPAPGAVPRPGLAALDPVNGLPLSWNPGRNPRGAGAEALLATPTGLWVGSDTTFIGNGSAPAAPGTYRRDRIAFFPLAGGSTLAPNDTGDLPGRAYLAGRLAASGTEYTDEIASRSYDGNTAVGATTTLAGTGIAWSQVRGAVMIDQKLYYGYSDGKFYSRTFDGTTFGAANEIDPYNDPYWSGVQSGSGQTYRGTPSSFHSEIQAVTGMFFSNGRLYYTLLGDRTLYSRSFTPDSGVVGAQRQVADTSLNWTDAGGFLFADQRLYWVTRRDGNLHRVTFIDGHPQPATSTVVSGPGLGGNDWRARGLFLSTVGAPK